MSTNGSAGLHRPRPLHQTPGHVDEFGISLDPTPARPRPQVPAAIRPAPETSTDARSQESPAEHAGGSSRREQTKSSPWKGDCVPLQVRVPSDMVESLRLLAWKRKTTMSELVTEALTEGHAIPKAWVQTRENEAA